ncbi:MAG TPA: hypothetical protein VGR04_07670 [Acidimicrobiia bacterium]|nr:hypothetical protein [Acidimicrobiia bacterium]
MADVWVVLLIVGFFAVCVALVRGCDRIIGGDDASELDDTEPSEADAGEREPTGVAT